jgi:hypothetical protein
MLNKGKMSLLESLNDANFTMAGWREYIAMKFFELGFEDTTHHSFMNTMVLTREIAKFITEIQIFRGAFRIKEAVGYLARHSCFDWTITEAEVGAIATHPGRELYTYFGFESICKQEEFVRKKLKGKFKQSKFNNYIISLMGHPVHLVPNDNIPLEKLSQPDKTSIKSKDRDKTVASERK